MERKPLELIRELQKENSELKKTVKRLEFQIQEMASNSSQRNIEMDQKMSALEMQNSNLKYEIHELRSEKRQISRKLVNSAEPTDSNDVIDLESDEDVNMHENLLEPMEMSSVEPLYKQEQRGFPFPCHLCSKSYVQKKRLITHLKKHQEMSKTSEDVKRVVQKAPATTYTCNFKDCGYSATFYPAMVRHKKSHTSDQLKCDYYMCEYSTTSRKRYFNHMTNKHGAEIGGDEQADDDEEQFSFQGGDIQGTSSFGRKLVPNQFWRQDLIS